MIQKKRLFALFSSLVIALALVAIPLFSALALDTMPKPIDPQSWQKQEDMLWGDLKPNPVIDWMTELNPAGLANPKASGNKDPINGALLLVDFWDRPFVTTQPLNTDLLGYYLFDKYGQYEKTTTKNPIIHVDLADYTKWIADYLNKNQALNHYRSIDEYWREASYGKWQINLDSFGPYHLQGMEFEFGLNYTSRSDIPPTFRRSTSRSISNESVALAYNNNVYLGDYDFFFILHSGYDESNVWYEFGQMQWKNGVDVPYEYGVRAKMDQIEVLLTEKPELLLGLEKTNVLTYNSTTLPIAGYNDGTYLRDCIAAIKAGTFTEFKFPASDRTWANGYTGQGSSSLTGGLGGPNTAPTRYVRWTSWIASTSSWSSSASASVPRSPANGGGSRSVSYSQQGESDAMGTFAHEFGHIVSHTDNYESTMWTQNVSPKTDYWDLMSRGDKVGPGGYHARWTIPGGQEAGGSPGHFMMFPKRRSGYYDNGDLLELTVAQLKTRTPVVTNIVSRNIPLNNAGHYPQLEQYGLKSPNYYKGLILEFDAQNADVSVLRTTGFSNTRYRAGWTGIEVVDKSGYDSFSSDHGVLISRLVSGTPGNPNASQNRWVIDSHLYNIGLVDFYPAPTWALTGDPTYYCIGHADQLNDALFHAGKSFVDTGYYSGDYTVNNNGTFALNSGSKHGSMRQWEPRNGRDIISGDTVNEWYDSANRLHFYILEKHNNPGRIVDGEQQTFLSYTVAVRHDLGVAVNGNLDVKVANLELETPGKVAVANFSITNTGDATDIVRVGVEGYLSPVLLNDLYAVEAGQTITVPVYVELPTDIRTKDLSGKSITLSASSETNGNKKGSATVKVEDMIAYNYNVYFEPGQIDVNIGESLTVDVILSGDINYSQFATEILYNSALLKYDGYTGLVGWAAACTLPAPGKIALRSVPGMNMLTGAPCTPPVTIVTLKFTALTAFSGDDITTPLSFASTVVSPTGGVTGAGAAPSIPADITLRRPVQGAFGNVFLITGQEIEIDFDATVTANNFKQTFDVYVDGEKVDYEFLSYFNFGSYAARGGVVNLRLPDKLDAGEPRGLCRSSSSFAFLARTDNTRGPAAAAKVKVEYRGAPNAPAPKTASWRAFWTERALGFMSRVFDYVSAEGGSNASDVTASMAEGRYPLYGVEPIARHVAEGVHRFFGRAEFLALPMCRANFRSYLVGPKQSVYEAPQFRELYVHGETTDLYTRTMIKATEVPGNFDPVTGAFKKPHIVGTSDDVMRHDTPMNAAGETIFTVNTTTGVMTPVPGVIDTKPARPRSDHFYFGEAFFDIFYELGVQIGSKQYPVGPTNNWDDNRYDVQLERAYEKAMAEGKWPNTDMAKSVKDYYVYGALVFQEMIPESLEFKAQSFPVNTRAELHDYDYDLYHALCGIHGKYEYWTGYGTNQGASTIDDNSKWRTPWFFCNQPDNFGPPADVSSPVGVANEPLYIIDAYVSSASNIMIHFNREVRTRANVVNAGNWRVWRGESETPITLSSASGIGYCWKQIRLATSGTTLDNGRPYGTAFRGFNAQDLAERSVANGGWISNTQATNTNALKFGEFVDLEEAIRRGAGIRTGGVRVEYVGASSIVRDWDGNELKKGRVDCRFEPWIGVAYRTPLTGLYIHMDTACGTNPNWPYSQKEIAITAGMVYESILQNNLTTTYAQNAGHELGDNGLGQIRDGFVTAGLAAGSYIAGPITYDRTGQRIADCAVKDGGGMRMPAGSVIGHHSGVQNGYISGTSVGDNFRIEGWGGTTFQTEDVLIMRDFNLCRYKNENLALHEGGHGVDSFTGTSSYANYVNRDISSARDTAVAAGNGRRWFTVDNVGSYVSSRGEYVSTGNTFMAGVMRESFQGNNDGTWTAVCTREEYYRYDPWGFEAHRRFQWNGELGLYYENKVGDPDYRVMIEDWEVLKAQNAEFAHWTRSNDLASWGANIVETSRYNPYIEAKNGSPKGSELNENVRWVSWNVPNVWDSLPTSKPTNPSYPNNRFDFMGFDFTSGLTPAGGNPYHPMPAIWSQPVAELTPFENQTHPFFRPGGVPRPDRPAALQALMDPVTGTISGAIISVMRPNVIEFTLTNPSGAVTHNNAQTSFELKIDGKYRGFYFWTYKVTGDVATVQLRIDRPLERTETVQVVLRGAPAPVPGEEEEVVEEVEGDTDTDTDADLDTDFDTDTDTDTDTDFDAVIDPIDE